MTWTLDSTVVTLDSTGFTMDGGTPGGGGPFAPSVATAIASASSSALVNWAAVVLVGPLYAGLSGVLDGYLWTSPIPQIGTTIYYDPTFITVLPNGEITSTSNNCSALIGFYDAQGNWNQTLFVIQPGLVGVAPGESAAGGRLNGALVPLLAAASSLASATDALSSGILMAAIAGDIASAQSALSAASKFAAQAQGLSSALSALTASIALKDLAAGLASATASLLAQIRPIAAAAGIASAQAALSTGVRMSAQAGAIASAQSAFGSGAGLFAAARGIASAASSLLTKIPLAAAAGAIATGTAATLTIPKPLAAAAAGTSSAIANFSTGASLRAQAAGLASASASGFAQTGAQFIASASAKASAQAAFRLPGQIFTAFAGGVSSCLAALLTVPKLTTPVLLSHQIPGIYQPGPIPFGQFEIGAGQESIYAIDWTYWLSFLWQPGFSATPGYVIRPFPWTGFQMICTQGGQTGNYPPIWPEELGQLVVDGSVIWQSEAIDSSSLQTSVLSASFAAPAGIIASPFLPAGNLTAAMINAAGAASGQSYEVVCTAQMASGDFLIGQMVFDVN